jgi:hypothetical protein
VKRYQKGDEGFKGGGRGSQIIPPLCIARLPKNAPGGLFEECFQDSEGERMGG